MDSQQNGTPDGASAPDPRDDERKKALEQAQKDAAQQRKDGGYQ